MRPALAGAAAAALVGAAHAGPAVVFVPAVRRNLTPSLHGLGRPGHIALTFDDGPDPASTPAFLEALAGLGWRATFFMLGSMAAASPTLAAEVVGAGHEVGLHGFSHRNQLARTPGAVADDLARGLDVLVAATGTAPAWWRPPYGVLSGGGLWAARRVGLRPVLWSAWGRDWRAEATPATVVADVMRGIAAGPRLDAIRPGPGHGNGSQMGAGPTVLLHDSDCTSTPEAWRSALGALPILAERFAAEGWSIGTLGAHGVSCRPRAS